MTEVSNSRQLAPVLKSIVVHRSPADVFRVFTEQFGAWWPKNKYSIHQAETAQCVMEPGVGGQIYEISRKGERGLWGTIRVWEPPHRFVMSWHPGKDPNRPTEVEVRFTAVPEGTRVDLEHRDWANFGENAAQIRESYVNGWVEVFEGHFAKACAAL